MEARAEQVSLLHGDNASVVKRRQYARPRTYSFHYRRADEGGVDGTGAEARDCELGLEGLRLSPEGISPHGDVEPAEWPLTIVAVQYGVGEHDESRAGAVCRQSRSDRHSQRRMEAEGPTQLVDDAGLPARNDEPFDALQ